MIYGNLAIIELLNIGKIGIEPFNPEQLQGVSYDLRLDGYFVRPYSCFSSSALHPCTDDFECHKSVSIGYRLLPKERVLASTFEKIGSKSLDITTKIFSKSSWARHGLEVCSCAGYGDPGYFNHWTLEIFNKNEYPVMLQKGMIIAQMSFEPVEGCSNLYSSKYNNDGKDKVFTDEERFEMIVPKKIKIIKEAMK